MGGRAPETVVKTRIDNAPFGRAVALSWVSLLRALFLRISRCFLFPVFLCVPLSWSVLERIGARLGGRFRGRFPASPYFVKICRSCEIVL